MWKRKSKNRVTINFQNQSIENDLAETLKSEQAQRDIKAIAEIRKIITKRNGLK